MKHIISRRLRLGITSCLALLLFASPAAAAIRYFEFASNTQVSPNRVNQLASHYNRNVLIGGDPNHDDFSSTMGAASRAGVKRHVYLEGPGGPTGNSGIEPEELARMKQGARFAGIDVKNDRNWMAKWNSYGWKIWTRHQIKNIYAGYESYEIDNLYRGIGESASALLAFLKEQQAWAAKAGVSSTILLKNISPDQWQSLAGAVKSGKIDRDGLTDFSISEEDFSASEKRQQRFYSASVGIQTLDSLDTDAYAARGEYRVD